MMNQKEGESESGEEARSEQLMNVAKGDKLIKSSPNSFKQCEISIFHMKA